MHAAEVDSAQAHVASAPCRRHPARLHDLGATTSGAPPVPESRFIAHSADGDRAAGCDARLCRYGVYGPGTRADALFGSGRLPACPERGSKVWFGTGDISGASLALLHGDGVWATNSSWDETDVEILTMWASSGEREWTYTLPLPGDIRMAADGDLDFVMSDSTVVVLTVF